MFAYRRIDQGHSRTISAFSSFMRKYLDEAIKADQLAQYVKDIFIAAIYAAQLKQNLRRKFKFNQNAELTLTMPNCYLGAL